MIDRRLVVGAALAGVAVPAWAQDNSRVRHHGVLVRVPDLDAALGFYGDGMGFAIADFLPREGWARLASNVPIYLEQSNGALPGGRVSNAEITFKVNNIEESRSTFQRAGAREVSENIFEVAVGKSIVFSDNAGIIHHALESNRPGAPFAEPRVYNTGFDLPVASIAPTRTLLEQGLGFVPMTERYFPPSIPYLEADSSFAFMLHHHQPGSPDWAPRANPQRSDLGVWQVFTSSDISSSVNRARLLGAESLLPRPERFAMGRRVSMVTPGGGPFEIWSWS
jgi:predicted enzyme related to lactoylglutathione lyase